MKIYTSYFARIKSFPPNVVPIAVCGKSPQWYRGAQYKTLAPKYGFFMKWKETRDDEYYIRCFKEQVTDCLTQSAVFEELSLLSNGNDVALVCYEKPSDFCHRHLIAAWLREAGHDVSELEYKS